MNKLDAIKSETTTAIAVMVRGFHAGLWPMLLASVFVRVENVMKNIRQNLHLKSMVKAYRFATIFLSSAILLIIIIAIVLRMLGISTDDISF